MNKLVLALLLSLVTVLQTYGMTYGTKRKPTDRNGRPNVPTTNKQLAQRAVEEFRTTYSQVDLTNHTQMEQYKRQIVQLINKLNAYNLSDNQKIVLAMKDADADNKKKTDRDLKIFLLQPITLQQQPTKEGCYASFVLADLFYTRLPSAEDPRYQDCIGTVLKYCTTALTINDKLERKIQPKVVEKLKTLEDEMTKITAATALRFLNPQTNLSPGIS